MARIALIGPGAIGATVVVELMRAERHEVITCARSPVARLTLETSEGASSVAPKLLTAPNAGAPVDWVLVATKAYDVAGAAVWLESLIGPNAYLAVLQNGVEHVARFRPFIAEDRILPVIVDIPVERIAPQHFRQRRAGTLAVPDGDPGRAFAALFAGTRIGAATTTDFCSAAWRKLAVNCAGAVSALLLQPAAIVQEDGVAEIMRALIRECIAVGRAEGASLDDGLVEEIIEGYRNGPPDAVNSLHADRLSGRPLEIDARNGAVIRFGRRHRIPTPVNDIMVTLLKSASPIPPVNIGEVGRPAGM